MRTIKIKGMLKSLNEKRTKAAVINITSDAAFWGVAYLIEMGFEFISGPVNALLIFCLFFIILYLFRYIFIHQIGDCARPVFKQLGITLPNPMGLVVQGMYIIMAAGFPFILLPLCLLIALPALFGTEEIHPLFPVATFPIIFFGIFMNSMIFFMARLPVEESKKEGDFIDGITIGHRRIPFFPRPGNTVRRYLEYVFIPLVSVTAIASLSHIQAYWYTLEDSSESWQLMIMTLAAFVPFRYLIMRINGAGWISLISFHGNVLAILLYYSQKMDIFNLAFSSTFPR